MNAETDSLIARSIAVAFGERAAKVAEEPLGSNWGPRVSQYIKAAGYDGPVYWCLCFAYWVVREAVAPAAAPIPRTGSCDLLLHDARKNGYLYEAPQEGDIFLVMATGDDAVHAGIVTKVDFDGSEIATCEGNSNTDGSRNGYAVVARSRRISESLRFVRWRDRIVGGRDLRVPAVKVGDRSIIDVAVIDGVVHVRARKLLDAIFGSAETGARLAFDASGQCLAWNGKRLPVPIVLRGGYAYAPVKRLVRCFGLDAKADGAAFAVYRDTV